MVGNGFTVRWEAEVSSPMHSWTSGFGTVMGTCGSMSNVTVQAMWLSSRSGNKYLPRTTGGADVTLQLLYQNRSVREGIFNQAVDNGDGTYTLQYTPKFFGVHTLYIRMFGEDVAGSPFTVRHFGLGAAWGVDLAGDGR